MEELSMKRQPALPGAELDEMHLQAEEHQKFMTQSHGPEVGLIARHKFIAGWKAKALRSVETKPESVIGKCIDKPIKDEALTAEDGGDQRMMELAGVHAMTEGDNGNAEISFCAGHRSRDGEVQALKAEIAVLRMNAEMEALSNTRSIFGGQEIVQRNIKLTSKLERMESALQEIIDTRGMSITRRPTVIARQALKDEDGRE